MFYIAVVGAMISKEIYIKRKNVRTRGIKTMKKEFRGLLATSGTFYACEFSGHERLIKQLKEEYKYLCYPPYNVFESIEELTNHFIYFNYHQEWREVKFDINFIDFTDLQLAWIMRHFHEFNKDIRKTILDKVKECSKQ